MRAAIIMCLAVRGGQGWSDSLSSDFHLLIGRKGGEGSVTLCNVLLELSGFFLFSTPPLFVVVLYFALSATTGGTRMTVIKSTISTWVHAFLCFNLTGMVSASSMVGAHGGKAVRRIWLRLLSYLTTKFFAILWPRPQTEFQNVKNYSFC